MKTFTITPATIAGAALLIMSGALAGGLASCSDDDNVNYLPPIVESPVISGTALAVRNCERAIALTDTAVARYFEGSSMAMARYYNPYTDSRGSEIGSIWMYTAAIEAVNSTLKGMTALKAAGQPALYDANYTRYCQLMASLVDNADYYAGTYTLTSYTGTHEWTVYGVDRGSAKGTAQVDGIHNVYDDQMWLIRELIEAYHLTGQAKYLEKAEYLTAYIIDGWDSTLDAGGNPHGGITWGPGYVTKHSCSNGPMVSPFVWLSEIYAGRPDQITYGIVLADGRRSTATKAKSELYLEMARDTYAWQKSHLMHPEYGVYSDMMGGDEHGGRIQYETVDGVTYRAHSHLNDRVGAPLSYNSGSMLSGAADLYRVTRNGGYLADLRSLSDCAWAYFATPSAQGPELYDYAVTGFNPWFNGVLMRAFAEATDAHPSCQLYTESFQCNLDYAWDHFLYHGLLPTNLLVGWNRDTGKNNVQGMFEFAYASQYGLLAAYQLGK